MAESLNGRHSRTSTPSGPVVTSLAIFERMYDCDTWYWKGGMVGGREREAAGEGGGRQGTKGHRRFQCCTREATHGSDCTASGSYLTAKKRGLSLTYLID